MERLSRELALVDERLDDIARRQLPDAADCLAPQQDASPVTSRPGTRSRGTPAIVGVRVLTAIVVVAALAGQDREKHVSTAVEAAASKTPAPRSRAPGVLRTLRWRAVPDATFYNVILWRDGTRALDLWSTSASVTIPKRRLTAGTYHWFVYPGFDKGGTRRLGRVAAQGQLRV